MDLQDFLQSLASLLGKDAEAMLPFILPLLKAKTGNDPIWDTIFTTDKGRVGLFGEYQNREAKAMSSGVSRDFQRQQLRARIADKKRTLITEKIYNETLKAAHGGLDYSKFIDSEVDNEMSKGGLRWVYENFLMPTDWDSSFSTGQNLGSVAYNLAQQGMRRSSPYSAAFGREVARSLFINKAAPGQPDEFNRYDWGGFSRKAVTELAKVLSDNVDFYQSVDASKPEDFTAASERFSSTLKNYTKALAPLKSIMGEDMPKMIKAMEEITGQQLTSMNVARVESLAAELAASTATGAWTMRDYTSMLTDVTRGLSRMQGASPWWYSTADMQAKYAMDIVKGGNRPTFLTDSQWNAYGRERVLTTASSGGADLFAKTYALYKEKAGNEDKTFADFEKEVMARSQNMDARVAARDMVGAMQDYMLNSAMGSRYYREAVQSGLPGRLARMVEARQQQDIGRMYIGQDIEFMQRMGIDIRDPKASETARSIYTRTLDVLSRSGGIGQMTDEQQQKELARLGINDKAFAAKFGDALRFLEDNRQYNPIVAATIAAGNERLAAENRARYDEQVKAISAVNEEILSKNTIVEQLFGGGWSGKRFADYIRNSNKLKHIPGTVAATLDIAGGLAADIYGKGTDKDTIRRKADLAANVFHYSASVDAKSNENFLKTLTEATALYTDMAGASDSDRATAEYRDKQAQARRLGYKMLAYQMAGSDVDAFLKDDIWTGFGDRMSEDVKYKRLEEWIRAEKTPTAGMPSRRLIDSIKLARLNSWARSAENNKDRQGVLDTVRTFTESWNKDTNNDGRVGFAEGLSEMWKQMQNDVNTTPAQREAFMTLNAKIKEIERTSSSGMSWQDRLIDVLESLKMFMSNIKSVTFGEGTAQGG